MGMVWSMGDIFTPHPKPPTFINKRILIKDIENKNYHKEKKIKSEYLMKMNLKTIQTNWNWNLEKEIMSFKLKLNFNFHTKNFELNAKIHKIK